MRTTRTVTLAWALWPWLVATSTTLQAGDDREAYSAASPGWLAAVGALTVPSQRYQQGQWRNYVEDCSATLIVAGAQRPGKIIVTAWHCVEHYNDLSKPIGFVLRRPDGDTRYRTARILRGGGGMHADWAILQLARPVPRDFAEAMRAIEGSAVRNTPLVMAGFSGDAGLGEHGNRLTFDPACNITGDATHGIETNCIAFKGASGGAVAQVSAGGQAHYVGVISQGDSEGLSRFVPIADFRAALDAELH